MKIVITCPYCKYEEEILANNCIEMYKCKNCLKKMEYNKQKGCIISLYGSEKCPFEK